ncbi:MAG: hypothetical protein QOD04_3151, partial [Pseudonocardiales bacterium]|nr:hypothetical protein [Pseudonocardiales bacterium]
EVVAVTGPHWTPDDDPHGIGSAVNTWIKEIRGRVVAEPQAEAGARMVPASHPGVGNAVG